MEDCLFCKIIAGEIPSTKVLRTNTSSLSGISIPRHRCMFWWYQKSISAAPQL